jgi:hypothetical protein
VPRPTPARAATSSSVGLPLCRPLTAMAASQSQSPSCGPPCGPSGTEVAPVAPGSGSNGSSITTW